MHSYMLLCSPTTANTMLRAMVDAIGGLGSELTPEDEIEGGVNGSPTLGLTASDSYASSSSSSSGGGGSGSEYSGSAADLQSGGTSARRRSDSSSAPPLGSYKEWNASLERQVSQPHEIQLHEIQPHERRLDPTACLPFFPRCLHPFFVSP
jgi:hypothetical protein